ncbi:IMPACT family protein [Marinobacter sp.]|uniref:IMPACT family protein n=1 Tax=Marinobacter sp. TaxID=50741 RepID=UPI00384DC9A5
MSSNYPVPAGNLERQTEVRKSRFVARVAPVASREEVRRWLKQARADHPDARHICWAYQIGCPGAAAEAAMNDDGEPSGTAGKPILGVIQHKDMGDVLVIVIRYFGGIKLGAGGLVRAYAGAAEAVLSAVDRVVQPSLVRVNLQLPFALEQPLRHWANLHGAVLVSVDYKTGVGIGLDVPEEHLDQLTGFCGAHGMDYSLEE